jgi:drug/metabolite transporter (DMT)-like permease
LFVLIWASGFVVAKYAAPHAEPLSFLVVRYAGVVVLMLVLALAASPALLIISRRRPACVGSRAPTARAAAS